MQKINKILKHIGICTIRSYGQQKNFILKGNYQKTKKTFAKLGKYFSLLSIKEVKKSKIYLI